MRSRPKLCNELATKLLLLVLLLQFMLLMADHLTIYLIAVSPSCMLSTPK